MKEMGGSALTMLLCLSVRGQSWKRTMSEYGKWGDRGTGVGVTLGRQERLPGGRWQGSKICC